MTKNAAFDHVTREAVENTLSHFRGHIQQIPPIFSAIRKDGKQLYKEARAGKSAEDIDIPSREVHVMSIELLDFNLPAFDVQVQCGGGTYIRSIIRDIGYKLDSVATTTYLQRIQQGQFSLDDPAILEKIDWTPEKMYHAIEKFNKARETGGGTCD